MGDLYGVRWLPLYRLSRDGPIATPPPESPNSEAEPLYPEVRAISGRDLPFDVPYGRRCYSMLIEPPVYLNYMTIGPGNSYMFPRRDGILLGGSFERGVWNTDVDAATTARILRENGALFGAMRG